MSACVRARQPLPDVHVAANAPIDQPMSLDGPDGLARFVAAVEPCRVRAMAVFPDVRDRFLRGLPARHTLFVTTRLRDRTQRFEQVFVAVDSVRADSLVGRLASDLLSVQGFRNGQRLVVAEADAVDWMISRPDGSEEGNLMGKFIDVWQARGHPPSEMCAGAAQ